MLPRPPSAAFYAFNDVPDSDEEIEVGGQGGSDASGAALESGRQAVPGCVMLRLPHVSSFP